jgi:WXG100 family type VII secretion target
MSGNLKVAHEALDEASAGLRVAAAGIETTLDDLARRLMARAPDWSGHASDAFDEARRRWDAAMRDMKEVLHAIGLAVASANDQYRAVESANARRFGG